MVKIKNPIKLIGDYKWTELRENMINRLELCRTQLEFEKVLTLLVSSVGSKKDIIRKRKELGIPITTDLLKELNNRKKGGKNGEDV